MSVTPRHPVHEHRGWTVYHVRAFEQIATGRWPRASRKTLAWLMARRLVAWEFGYAIPESVRVRWREWCGREAEQADRGR